MKKQLLTLVFALVFTTSLFSQVVTVSPVTNGIFYDTVSQMSDSSADLYQDHISGPLESFMFTTDLFTNSKFYADNDSQFFNESSTSLGIDLFFTKISTNIEGFAANGNANIGFFGNESHDRNKLLVKGYTKDGLEVQTELVFDYHYSVGASVTPPPTAYTVSADPNAPVNSFYSYWHDNQVKGLAEQKSESRFAMFQSYDPVSQELGNEWIFAIDDREDEWIDYDDGFFYVSGDLTPVPEPSSIAFIAAIGLVGVICLNYRKKNRSKN